jgi:hypothetical protein
MIRENGGWEKFRMIEVEKYPCNDKREAEKRECEVMKELKASMNMVKSYVSEEECKEEMKQYYYNNKEKNKDRVKKYHEKYYENNKDKIKEYKKEYSEKNKEVIQYYQKEYRESNKDRLKEQKKQYRDLNKDKIKEQKRISYEMNKKKIKENMKERIYCDCGCEVNKSNLKRHQSTEKHIDMMKNKI